MNCPSCPNEALNDYPLCPTCATRGHFDFRADCRCTACVIKRAEAAGAERGEGNENGRTVQAAA
jgi:hypothetical protein